MKRSVACLLVVFLVLAGMLYQHIGFAQQTDDGVVTDTTAQNQSQQFSALMRMKLEKAKGILEGLSLENYQLVNKNAKELRLLSLESGWNAIQTKEYSDQSEEFRRACDIIAESADQQDINRAALGYVALTVHCVECHSYMRGHNQRPQPEHKDDASDGGR